MNNGRDFGDRCAAALGEWDKGKRSLVEIIGATFLPYEVPAAAVVMLEISKAGGKREEIAFRQAIRHAAIHGVEP